jgi:hypothetical protein
MYRRKEWQRTIEIIKESMVRTGLSREFVDSIDHKSFSELYPELMRWREMKGRITRMQPLRYEFLGIQVLSGLIKYC